MDNHDDYMVVVKDLYKSFRLPHEQHSGLKQLLLNIFKRPSKRHLGYETQHVLDDVSFEIKKGEFFGIVGRNGSGKSTLLKLLAGIYAPDRGLVQVNGSLTPFIELGVGFNPELTGRENVYLNGALLGFSHGEMDEMYDDIVAFAELEKFMDQKLKNYSSGMQVRLAFSIATRANSDVLLIDEVLAVGDAAFQQKCYSYFDKLKEEKRTIILVTHDMGAVRQFCDRAMLVSGGRVQAIGSPDKISIDYERLNYNTHEKPKGDEQPITLKTLNSRGEVCDAYEYGQPISVVAQWRDLSESVLGLGVILYKNNEVIFATNTHDRPVDLTSKEIVLTLDVNEGLGDGRYKFRAILFGKNKRDEIADVESSPFTIYHQPKIGRHKEQWEGVAYLNNKWCTLEEHKGK